jgi:PIN domain nuclease of toxin-antitoxin system
MTQACIDTHALIWHLSKPKRLGASAARLLRDADAGRVEVLVPAIVAVELSLLQEAGRRVVGPPELHALLGAQPAFRLLPLDLPQALEFALLRTLRDPFDRMVVAAARVAGVPLITADSTIQASALVRTIWD